MGRVVQPDRRQSDRDVVPATQMDRLELARSRPVLGSAAHDAGRERLDHHRNRGHGARSWRPHRPDRPDHKTFPGSRTQAVEEAIGYAGQLGAYRRMLEASTGKPVIACYIHCPVPGIVVPVLST